jgi:cytochrome c nitrite reductase small subunit
LRNMKRVSWKKMSLAAMSALGVVAGLSMFTFQYAEGFSYFSHDPKACANCHVMNEYFDSWQKSSHHGAAVCVDCHMPEGLGAKLVAKADNGYRHSKGFTLQDFHEPIMIKRRNAEILQNNCLRCHEANVQRITGAWNDEVRCVKCHSNVGHGQKH